MRICVIGPKNSNESLMIKNQAELMGIECKRVYMNDIYFELKGSRFEAVHRKLDLLGFDVFLFRSVKKFTNEALLLAEYLYSLNKKVVDESLAVERHLPFLNKFYTKYFLSKSGIPQIDTVLSNGLKTARDVLMEIEHPILIKSISEENKIKVTHSEDWTDSYDYARTNKIKSFVYTHSYPVEKFQRIFVIGNKVTGGFERTDIGKEEKLNYITKYKTRNLDLSKEQTELALAAVKASKFEIASVDMIEHQDNLYILDVNRSPRFSSFQKVSGVNFPEKIIRYCIEK
jgi:RimK family alpha-L-glutamate ligase